MEEEHLAYGENQIKLSNNNWLMAINEPVLDWTHEKFESELGKHRVYPNPNLNLTRVVGSECDAYSTRKSGSY